MKTFLLIISFLICSFKDFSQRVQLHEEFYADGKISKRGLSVQIDSFLSRDSGIWTCWYPNGQKLSEDLRNKKIYPEKYINCWTNTGKQICTNGNGRFWEHAADLGWEDNSTQFTIKDSIRNGPFDVYIPYKKRMVKAAEGNYINGLIQGEIKYFYETGQLSTIQTIKDGKANGWRKEFFKSGKLEKEGRWFKGYRDSVWTFYNYLGNMEKKVTYVRGSDKEHVVEFYANGEKRAEGDYEYVHQKIEKNGKEYIEVKTTLLIPVKNGLWMYYSNTGVPSKKETYANGELVK